MMKTREEVVYFRKQARCSNSEGKDVEITEFDIKQAILKSQKTMMFAETANVIAFIEMEE